MLRLHYLLEERVSDFCGLSAFVSILPNSPLFSIRICKVLHTWVEAQRETDAEDFAIPAQDTLCDHLGGPLIQISPSASRNAQRASGVFCSQFVAIA